MSDPEYLKEQRVDLERVAAIAEHLPGWEVEEHIDWAVSVKHRDGYGMLFSRKGDRWEVYGTWPKDDKGDLISIALESMISVNVTRTPKEIATDIKRRFLPKFLKCLSESQEVRRSPAM